MKIRAAVLERFGDPLEVQELDLAEPRAGEVLVRLVACWVCHTDLYTASGADPSGYAPTVLGRPAAAANTIRQRNANACELFGRRAHRSSTSRSSSPSTTSARFAMTASNRRR